MPPRRFSPLLAPLVLVGGLGGCAALDKAERERVARVEQEQTQARTSLETNLQRWMGHPASELVAQWGLPTHTLNMPDRTAVYEYDWVGAELVTADPVSGTRFEDAQANGADWCRERFVVGANGRLSSWKWEGNGAGCTAR